jgi:hypothetical protein
LEKSERLEEFFRRLGALPAASSAAEAQKQIAETLDAVEDELTGIPNNPDAWQEDGRMYPIQEDNWVPQPKGVLRGRSAGHLIDLGANGAIVVRRSSDKSLVFEKLGADGNGVNR